MTETVLTLTGKADDLLSVSRDGAIKMTRLFYLGNGLDVENEETVDICLTSTNPNLDHPIFDKVNGKYIRFTLEVSDDCFAGTL